jgi:hypothetical protein
MKILSLDFSAKVVREDILKLTVRNESLHEISGVCAVKFATSKYQIVKSTVLPHHDIHKCTWTSPDGRSSD